MDGCWRESGEGDWEAGVAGVMGLAVEIGRIGGMGEESGEMMGLAVEIGRIGRVRWGWPLRSGGLGDE